MADVKIITEDNTEAITPAIPLPIPFAGGNGATASAIPVAESESSVNIPKGFPSAYSRPTQGGKFVTRGEMNGVVKLATANECRRQLGGINTFNSSLVAITGGYDRGAVLDWWDSVTSTIYKVISLKDANTVDFTANGPDGENWTLCSRQSTCFPPFGRRNATMIGKFANLELPSSYGWITGVFEMPFDGYVLCQQAVKHTTTAVNVPLVEGIQWEGHLRPNGANNYNVSMFVTQFYMLYPDLVSGESFLNQRHEVFLALADADEEEPDVDMENIGSGGSNCSIHMVSSSGQDGGGAPGPLLVPKGSKMRLFGRQGYTVTSETESLPSADLYTVGHVSPYISRKGELSISMRIEAYPL